MKNNVSIALLKITSQIQRTLCVAILTIAYIAPKPQRNFNKCYLKNTHNILS